MTKLNAHWFLGRQILVPWALVVVAEWCERRSNTEESCWAQLDVIVAHRDMASDEGIANLLETTHVHAATIRS